MFIIIASCNAHVVVNLESWSANHLSHLVGKPIMWFLNRSDTNRAAQAQINARCLKFWILVEEGL